MFRRRTILVTGGGGYFGHKLGNEVKKMGAVVLFYISWPLDEVVYEQMECFQVDLIGKLRDLLWIILPKQLHSDLAFVVRTDESIKFGKISAQSHAIVKKICFPNGNVLFLSLFSLSKN